MSVKPDETIALTRRT